jgi:glycosyltransferase involved in cell wall biosynthesis
MRIFFLDQTGKLGGAELCLKDLAQTYGENALVGLFTDGPFKDLLRQHQIPVEVLTTQVIKVTKQSNLFQASSSLTALIPLIYRVIQRARNYDLIYANTQKALVVGAIASLFTHRPLIYHLHDILSPDHFSATNIRIAVTLANRFASAVIANSQASKTEFIQSGGNPQIVKVIYNGFVPETYQVSPEISQQLRDKLGLADKFVIGQFSRLAPWKGQHILIEALTQCVPEVIAILVGDALFGEQNHVKELHQQIKRLGLENRVKFLGFRSDIPELMTACDLVAHTSTAPEPFGRVIVEGMLCGKPVVASKAGGVVELIQDGINGFLFDPNDFHQLAKIINTSISLPEQTAIVSSYAKIYATQHFDLKIINREIDQLIHSIWNPLQSSYK